MTLLALACVVSAICYIDGYSFGAFFDSFAKEVKKLPGLSYVPNFRHFSGFLQANEEKTRFLHFWFVESQRSPVTDPLLVWLNGGPGCSSLDGFLSELGPFHVKDDGTTLYENVYAWNKVANVIFLESPAGVGYSFSTDGNTTTDDDLTSLQNYNAIKEFLRLMPKYKTNEFYVTGESYGGIYVPMLASRIIEGLGDFPINFKGVAIGNGMLNWTISPNSLVDFLYGHGLVDERAYRNAEQTCCQGCGDSCDFVQNCHQFYDDAISVLYTGLNMYDLFRDCYISEHMLTNRSRYYHDIKLALPNVDRLIPKMQSKADRRPNGNIPCINTTAETNWLNLTPVRKALYIPAELPPWEVCGGVDYHDAHNNMEPHIRQILSAGGRVLIYNGDADMACNFIMGQEFSARLNLPV